MENRKTISSILGSHLKSLRMRSELSQSELSKKIGVTATHIGYIENAKRLPSTEVVEAYAYFFEQPLAELLQLRMLTIIETVELLGDETPPAIKNERNMIVHGRNTDYSGKHDSTYITNAEKIINPMKPKKKDTVTVKVVIDEKGNLTANGIEMSIEQLTDYLANLSPKK